MCSEGRTEFLHKVNEFGVFESACPACFEVISKQACEADLAIDEAAHVCKDLILQETLDYFRAHLVQETRISKQNPRRVRLWDRVQYKADRLLKKSQD